MLESPFSAVVLAAGRSTRMGRDKALLEVDGVRLWQRQRDVLAQAGATEIFLSARPDQTWTRTATGFDGLLYDALPHAGPLCGVTAALERASHRHVAVIAIDLPRMPVEWYAMLRTACGPGVGAVGRREGRFEPLAAIYPHELMTLAWEALAAGCYGFQPLLGEAMLQRLLHVHEIAASEAPFFENWNEPAASA